LAPKLHPFHIVKGVWSSQLLIAEWILASISDILEEYFPKYKVEIPYSMYRVKKFDMIIITLPSLCVFVLLPKGLQTSNSSK